MPTDALAPEVARASTSMVIGCAGQTTCIVVPELVSSTWVKSFKIRFKMLIYFSSCLKQFSMCVAPTELVVERPGVI